MRWVLAVSFFEETIIMVGRHRVRVSGYMSGLFGVAKVVLWSGFVCVCVLCVRQLN